MLEQNLKDILYFFRSENYKGYHKQADGEVLRNLLKDVKDENLKKRISDFVFCQEDLFFNQIVKDTEYFYKAGWSDGINLFIGTL